MQKLIKIISGILLATFFLTNFSFAELSASWYTHSLNVSVGDTVKVDLYINPSADHPVVTISNTLNYDPTKLKFITATFPDKWFVLSENPNSITDEKNGFLRRTAGYANGINKNAKYMTYEFQAIKSGDAEIFIEDGTVLDQENTNLGFQKKDMKIHISDVATTTTVKSNTSTSTPTTVPSITPKTISFGLNIFGQTAIHVGQDYTFQVFSDASSTSPNLGLVNMVVTDAKGNQVYGNKSNFNGQGLVSFTVPQIVLTVGDYKIHLVTTYPNSPDQVMAEKDIGVLASDKSYLDVHKFEFFSLFGFVVLLAFLYHIHRDHIIFRNLRRKAREYHEIHVGHRK